MPPGETDAAIIQSPSLEIDRRSLALLVALDIEGHLLTFGERHTGAFDCGDVHKHILAAVIGLNEIQILL